jgi:hypothetical protein
VFTPTVRACLLLGVAATAAGAGGQPTGGAKAEPPVTIAGVRPYFTALPDLKPPTYETVEVKNPDGTTRMVTVEKGEILLPALPALAADAPPLRKVQFEQVREGLAYIQRSRELIRLGVWVPADFRQYAEVTTETYRLAAGLEEKSANRVPWYEVRVRQLKEAEDLIDRSVRIGSAAPATLHYARFQRLGAEADLLKLKAEVEKANGK